jgi:hypothetical protein
MPTKAQADALQHSVGLPIDVQGLHAVQEHILRQLAQDGQEFQCHIWPINTPDETWFRVVLRLPGVPRDIPLLDGRAKPRRWKQLTALTRFLILTVGTERGMFVHFDGIDPHNLRSKGE